MPLFRGVNLSQGQTDFNYEMSNVQHCVRWGFEDIVRMCFCLSRFHVVTVPIKCVFRLYFILASN